MSFGYETQIPPISTLTFYNAIANGGKMVRPLFTKEILQNGKSVQTFSTEVIKSAICSDRTLALIQEMLLGVVEQGTGKAVHSEAVRIAGKTGTAQIATGGVYRTSGHQVSFCGYFPADHPKYSCIVVIRRPRIGYPSGGTMSGGVVRSIAEKIYANNISIDLDTMQVDSTAVLLPRVKGGEVRAIESVLDRLDIPMDEDSLHTRWAKTSREEEVRKVQLQDVTLREGLVPLVVGMGAKDAIYLLEQAGLRVSMVGVGRVAAQSIPAGHKVVKGQGILITLK